MTEQTITPTQRDPEQGCICQGCGRAYRVDFMLPDDLWNAIRPAGKSEGGGLLCGSCIADAIEAIGQFDAFFLARHAATERELADKALREALEKAIGWFDEYATEHANKSVAATTSKEVAARWEKAKRNKDRADELRAALQSVPVGEEDYLSRAHAQIESGQSQKNTELDDSLFTEPASNPCRLEEAREADVAEITRLMRKHGIESIGKIDDVDAHLAALSRSADVRAPQRALGVARDRLREAFAGVAFESVATKDYQSGFRGGGNLADATLLHIIDELDEPAIRSLSDPNRGKGQP